MSIAFLVHIGISKLISLRFVHIQLMDEIILVQHSKVIDEKIYLTYKYVKKLQYSFVGKYEKRISGLFFHHW